MRKISSKETEKKKQKRNQIIVSVILIFVMFFSVLGFAFNGGDNETTNKLNYNGFEFINQNGFWIFEKEAFQFVFRYNPKEVRGIDSEVDYINKYLDKPLYIYSENDEASSEIYNNFDQIVQRMQFACFNEKECDENLPTKTCENNFIIITENNVTNITQTDNCVFIEGAQENLTMLTDEFLFKILGIRE